MNWLERTMWSESQSSSDSSDEYNPILSQPSGVTSTADEVANKESQEIIQNIVNNELPKNERRAIVRRFRDGETYKEIAARLNVSTETARNFVFRGLEKIRKKAKNAGLDNCQDL